MSNSWNFTFNCCFCKMCLGFYFIYFLIQKHSLIPRHVEAVETSGATFKEIASDRVPQGDDRVDQHHPYYLLLNDIRIKIEHHYNIIINVLLSITCHFKGSNGWRWNRPTWQQVWFGCPNFIYTNQVASEQWLCFSSLVEQITSRTPSLHKISPDSILPCLLQSSKIWQEIFHEGDILVC